VAGRRTVRAQPERRLGLHRMPCDLARRQEHRNHDRGGGDSCGRRRFFSTMTEAVTHPYWSMKGLLAFASWEPLTTPLAYDPKDLNGNEVANAQIWIAPVNGTTFDTPTLLVPRQTNLTEYYPTISDDSLFVAFNESSCSGPPTNQSDGYGLNQQLARRRRRHMDQLMAPLLAHPRGLPGENPLLACVLFASSVRRRSRRIAGRNNPAADLVRRRRRERRRHRVGRSELRTGVAAAAKQPDAGGPLRRRDGRGDRRRWRHGQPSSAMGLHVRRVRPASDAPPRHRLVDHRWLRSPSRSESRGSSRRSLPWQPWQRSREGTRLEERPPLPPSSQPASSAKAIAGASDGLDHRCVIAELFAQTAQVNFDEVRASVFASLQELLA